MAENRETHERKVKEGFFGWEVTCSCGWTPGGGSWPTSYDTKLAAMAAGDRHLAEVLDRAAWKQA